MGQPGTHRAVPGAVLTLMKCVLCSQVWGQAGPFRISRKPGDFGAASGGAAAVADSGLRTWGRVRNSLLASE
jgi:hypothetical protein